MEAWDDNFLRTIDQQIEQHKRQLQRLFRAREAYIAESGGGSGSHQIEASERPVGISAQLIDTLIQTWPNDKPFSAEDLYQELAKSYDMSGIAKRNASAMICSLLSRRVKQNKVLKCDRGVYRKVDSEMKKEQANVDELLL